MNELLLMFAKVLPIDKIVEEIKEAATEYTLTHEKEALNKVEMYCMILLGKKATEGKELEAVMKDLNEHKQIAERMQANKM